MFASAKEFYMKKILTGLMITVMALPLWLSGCAPKVGGSDYDASRTRTVQTVHYGTVDSIRIVQITDDSNTNAALGTVGGGVAGGVLGSLIGGGRGRTLATVAGAAAGAAAGYAGARALSDQEGYEITVKLDSGDLIAVTQGGDIAFNPGQRVRVMSGGGTTRVVPL